MGQTRRQHQDTREQIRHLREQIGRLDKRHKEDTRALSEIIELFGETRIQLQGGTTDPRKDTTHPGYILTQLGWGFVPHDNRSTDHLGLHWMDPEEKGTGRRSLIPLSMALAIVYRRLAERRSIPDWMERISADH